MPRGPVLDGALGCPLQSPDGGVTRLVREHDRRSNALRREVDIKSRTKLPGGPRHHAVAAK